MKINQFVLRSIFTGAMFSAATAAFAGANPSIGWNYGTIVATPHYPIVGESAKIEVTVTNPGDVPASNVQVKISFNDWGVTFQGWQEIDTITVPSIAAGGSVTVETHHTFQNRTHTCLEALIVGADEDTDPNDDRGQINLEVINSGETFSWDVPVVNNGDHPLNLLVVGMCKRNDPAGNDGAAGGPCRDDVKQVELAPGEELLVPVNIDLRDFAIGEQLEFELNAFDLGAGGDAFLPQNRNHVLIRIIRGTARSIDESAKVQVNGVAAGVAHKGMKKRIQQAAAMIANALNDKAWVGDNGVKKKGGAAVFAHADAAVNQLMALLDTCLNIEQKAALDDAARKLSDAARILAQTAGGNLKRGDDNRAAGDYRGAIHAYKHAWQAAQ